MNPVLSNAEQCEQWGGGGPRGGTSACLRLMAPRSASKKQKKTAELMPLLSARGPTPLRRHSPAVSIIQPDHNTARTRSG